MDKPIYFSKIEFCETIGYGKPSGRILLNIPARELSCQVIELPMNYYDAESHICPSEKLYRYIIKHIFDKQKKMYGWYTPYGGFSIPG